MRQISENPASEDSQRILTPEEIQMLLKLKLLPTEELDEEEEAYQNSLLHLDEEN